MRALVVSANREMLPSPVVPIGCLTIVASAADAHEVSFLDLCFEADPIGAIEARVREFRPEAVGIGLRNLHGSTELGTAALHAHYADVVSATRRATRAPVILGGAGFSLRPRTLLDRLGADHGVVGEGEQAFRGVLDALSSGRAPPRLVTSATFACEGSPTEPGELDRLPRPARALVDPRYRAFDGTESLQTKRGCAFECAYCDYPDIEGRRVRVRDPEAVADEAVLCASLPSVTHLFIVDSVFNAPPAHALLVSRALEARGAPLPWVCYLSPLGFDAALAAAMARAGCVGVEIGSDAGTAEGLTRLNKPFALADVERATALCRAHGILDCHTFVLGVGDETVDDARRTLDFVAALDPGVAVFCVFMEDREVMTLGRAKHRDALLRLLGDEAPRHRGWSVPELSIRFGTKLTRLVAKMKLRGPPWLYLAASRSPGPTRPSSRGSPG